ncbi:MAG TPA: MASE1 domain-containing protein [Dyella sp.]|uniref:MASE1 domain-containing protein n=1 Tax=Dyella sp. TaxID=1869338 RepID=UPI002B5E1B52|nr:MASE1 domain-containing protein [Dyella sp.]HUB88605.1 MASE1 domain-containing protein [Dyella sp.]
MENKWLRQLAVFVVYGTLYTLFRRNYGIWHILSGLRLSCLLLLPYRYWPTLALAELGPGIYYASPAEAPFGPIWWIGNSIPSVLYAMPIVAWCKRSLGLFPSRHLIRAKALFICVALSTTVWTTVTALLLLAVTQPPGTQNPYHFQSIDAVQLFLGHYAGILTVLPIALALKLQRPQTWRDRFVNWISNPLLQESCVLLLPSMAILYWLNLHAPENIRPVIRMTMLLPAAWLTMKHGWRAASVGTTAAIICMFLSTEPLLGDVDVIGAQAFITFSVTCLLALGVRVSMQNAVEEQERIDAKAAIKLAQQGLYLCELRMRQASQTLEQVAGGLQLTQTRLLNRFKHMIPPMEGQSYYKQMAATQNQVYQLVESMHPTAWRERGLPAALRETIGRALDEANVAYRFALTGRGLSQLSPSVHAAIYRLACEAVVYVFAQHAWSTINFSLRGGLTHGQRWVVLRVEGQIDHIEPPLPLQKKQESQHLAAKLGANSLNAIAMRDYARLYNGELHTSAEPNAFRMTVLLHDAGYRMQERGTATPASLPELYIR